MASPSSVLTLGLGSWGSASLLVTLGFGTGAAAAPEPYGSLQFSCLPHDMTFACHDHPPQFSGRPHDMTFACHDSKPQFTSPVTP